tara:strand:- start:3327 stop:3725 length:399 start_codon:yes stop_codon:yes gene_type:complete
MFNLSVRDHFMIAHSFRGEVFGRAQNLHGATYVVDIRFARPELDSHGLVVDIGLAQNALKLVLDSLNYRNLDELDEFKGVNTTTERLAKIIFIRMADKIKDGSLGLEANGLTSMVVKLNESHVAWASYECKL